MDGNNDRIMAEGDESFEAALDENVENGGGRHRQQENEANDDEEIGNGNHTDNPTIIGNAMIEHHLDGDCGSSQDDGSESEDEEDDDDDDDEEDDDIQMDCERRKTNESIQAFLLPPAVSPPRSGARLPPSQHTSKLYDFYLHSDDIAMEVGEMLLAKKNPFPLKLAFHMKKRFTARGAQAIVQGLQHYFSTNHHQKETPPPPPHALLQLTLEQIHLGTMSRAYRHMVLAIIPKISVPTELLLFARCSNRDADQIGSKLIEARNVVHLKKLQLIMGPSVTEAGATRLCRGLAQSKLETLELRGYGLDATNRFQQSPRVMQLLLLQAIATVREFVLEYPLSEDDVTLLGHALEGNHQLSLLYIRLQRTLTVPCAMTLAQGIQRSQIDSLSLRGATFEHTISAEVGEVLYQGIQYLQTLRHLTIGPCMQATASLGNCLTAARLSSLQVFTKESSFTPTILHALPNASQLSMLRFGPLLDSHDMRLLCQALPHLTSLTKLSIRGQLICDEGVALVKECRNRDVSVTHDEIKSRRVRAVGAELLMMAIANHPCLEEFNLYGCIDLAFLGLDMIGHWLPRLKLKKLCLDLLYEFDHKDEDENGRRAHQKAFQGLVEGFRYNYHLEQYRVSSFLHLPVEQKAEITYYVELNLAGRYLLGLDHHHAVATSVWCHVLARWKDNANMFYGLLREQPTLLAAASLVGCDGSAGSKRPRES